MTIDDMLKQGEPIFKKIDKAAKEKNIQEVEKLVNSPQPKDWIITKKSKVTGMNYQTNKVGLIEAVLFRIFGAYEKQILYYSIHQDRNKFAATVNLKVSYRSLCISGYESTWGIATVIAPSIEHLELATPVAVSRAFRNSCKYIGDLFGKSLNREVDGDELETIYVDKNPDPDPEFKKLLQELRGMKYAASCEEFVLASPYSDQLKYNLEIQKIISSKPVQPK